MYNFQFFMPTKVLFGAGQLKNLHLEMRMLCERKGESIRKCIQSNDLASVTRAR